MTDDLPSYVRRWLLSHADMPVEAMADAIDADLRREFGAREVYIPRRAKAARLAALAALPPDMPIEAAAKALGVSTRHLRDLRRLARDCPGES